MALLALNCASSPANPAPAEREPVADDHFSLDKIMSAGRALRGEDGDQHQAEGDLARTSIATSRNRSGKKVTATLL